MTGTTTGHGSAVVAELLATVPTGMLIGGQWVASGDDRVIDVLDPATGALLAQVADGSVEDGLAAVAAAHDALAAWSKTAPRVRGEILRRAFELMTERSEDLARLIVLENGKALPDARGEVAYAAEFFRWFSEEAVRAVGDIQTAPSGTNRIMVLRQPIGVAVLVTPWNFPAAMATRKIGPALAAGCTVILKPASETPLTALAIGAILIEAGWQDLCGMISGRDGGMGRTRMDGTGRDGTDAHGRGGMGMPSSVPCCMTLGCGRSPSPGPPRSGGGCWPPRRTAWSTRPWNSVATPRSWSSTTLTSTPRSTAR